MSIKKGDIVTTKLRLMILGLSMIFLSGCGGDSSDNQTSQTIQGVVIGSHYEGAWVCVDINSNSTCDEETITVTDANGHWTLDAPQNRALNVVAEIHVDNIKRSNYPAPPSSTLVEKPMIFVAPLQGEVDDQLIVSPISTMVHTSMQENDTSFEVVKESVAAELEVSSDVLLTNYDVENPSPDQATLQQQSADEIEMLEVTMTYHLNYALFTFKYVGQVESGGRYTITDYYITSGQDPDHHIFKEKVVDLHLTHDSYATLDFVLGRKGSTDTADWWKGRIRSDQNQFNSEPKKLNFAFIGDLTLNIDGKYYVFFDFALAQGHTAWYNNWWVGGKECRQFTGYNCDCIVCDGKDENGNMVPFVFSSTTTNSIIDVEKTKQ